MKIYERATLGKRTRNTEPTEEENKLYRKVIFLEATARQAAARAKRAEQEAEEARAEKERAEQEADEAIKLLARK